VDRPAAKLFSERKFEDFDVNRLRKANAAELSVDVLAVDVETFADAT